MFAAYIHVCMFRAEVGQIEICIIIPIAWQCFNNKYLETASLKQINAKTSRHSNNTYCTYVHLIMTTN